MELRLIAGWIATALFSLLAIFQILLFLGLPLGSLAWGGRHRKLTPGLRLASLASAVVLLAGILPVLEMSGIASLIGSRTISTIALWVLAAVFALSTLGNITSKSGIEKAVMTPVAAVLTMACLVLALGI